MEVIPYIGVEDANIGWRRGRKSFPYSVLRRGFFIFSRSSWIYLFFVSAERVTISSLDLHLRTGGRMEQRGARERDMLATFCAILSLLFRPFSFLSFNDARL